MEKEEEEDMEEEAEAVSTDQTVDRMKRTNRSIQLAVAIQYPNLIVSFDKSKVKCYNCQKTCHYAKDCWNPTKRVEENINLMIEEKNETTILLVYDEKIQEKKNHYLLYFYIYIYIYRFFLACLYGFVS